MTAVLLIWNEARPWPGTYAEDVDTVHRTGILRISWPAAPEFDAQPGVDVWLIIRAAGGQQAGLIGHGILAGMTPSAQASRVAGKTGRAEAGVSDEPAADGPSLLIDLDLLLQRGDEIPAEAVMTADELPDPSTGRTSFTAQELSEATDAALRLLWSSNVPAAVASTSPLPGSLPAAAVMRRPDNRFETDDDLRRRTLAARGSVCHGCDLDGEQTYGPAGADLVQVHLITPPELVGASFEPDPLVDLVPLCPTCHVVAHGRAPQPYSVSEIRSMIRAGGFLPGAAMSAHQLDAERAATRILEAGT